MLRITSARGLIKTIAIATVALAAGNQQWALNVDAASVNDRAVAGDISAGVGQPVAVDKLQAVQSAIIDELYSGSFVEGEQGATLEHVVERKESGRAEISWTNAPLGKANSYILHNLHWRIEEEASDKSSHFEVVQDEQTYENVLRVTLHGNDGDGHAKSSDNGVARQEIKSSLKGVWSRKLPSSPELWQYELTVKMHPEYEHTGDRFYHLFQLKFEKAHDGTPLLTVGTRQSNFGMYVAMSKGSSQQKFVQFGPLAQFRGRWLRVELFVNAQKGPNATIQAKVYDASSGQLMHTSQTVKGRMDWNSSKTFRPKLGQYKSLANGKHTNVVYYKKLAMS